MILIIEMNRTLQDTLFLLQYSWTNQRTKIKGHQYFAPVYVVHKTAKRRQILVWKFQILF
jgi:hypothetical protein